MKFEIGQDRVQVHFLLAYVDVAMGLKRFPEILDFPCPEIIIKVFNEKYTSLFSTSDLNKLFTHIEKDLVKEPEKFYELVNHKFNKDYRNSLSLLSGSYSPLSQIKSAIKAVENLSVYLPTLRYYELVATRHLKNSLSERKIALPSDDLFVLATNVSDKTLLYLQEKDLLKIALKNYKKSSNLIKKELLEHTGKYKYFEMHASSRMPLEIKDFFQRINLLFTKTKNELRERLQNLERSQKKLQERKDSLILQRRFNSYEENIIQILSLVSGIKTKLADAVCLINYNFYIGSEKLSKEFNLPRKEILLMLPQEIRVLKNQGIPPNINQRTEAAIWQKSGKVKIYFGVAAKNFLKRKITPEKVKIDQVRGTPASLGKIMGVVKVVESLDQFDKIKGGEILVSSDASPDFAPLFSKVIGIITNEGGVISHAAIVAREFGIPCIVGTKNATKILKDNQQIELDATKGIVKVIK